MVLHCIVPSHDHQIDEADFESISGNNSTFNIRPLLAPYSLGANTGWCVVTPCTHATPDGKGMREACLDKVANVQDNDVAKQMQGRHTGRPTLVGTIASHLDLGVGLWAQLVRVCTDKQLQAVVSVGSYILQRAAIAGIVSKDTCIRRNTSGTLVQRLVGTVAGCIRGISKRPKEGAVTYLVALVEIKSDLMVLVSDEVTDVLTEFGDVIPSKLPRWAHDIQHGADNKTYTLGMDMNWHQHVAGQSYGKANTCGHNCWLLRLRPGHPDACVHRQAIQAIKHFKDTFLRLEWAIAGLHSCQVCVKTNFTREGTGHILRQRIGVLFPW
ncbi:myosin family protein with Dil domain-containing protein [Actinidia rufa]|uniref:Myosin family protein with Dil domain-containing protein n=1 Tax=Actinidia rufa TaxID=165716 RepID=A0A7J0H2L4_9ERIC|nr:myosin family protein with Dil domain-containing protein [Actinidia rufa]